MKYWLILVAIIIAMIMLMTGCVTTSEYEAYESYYEPVHVYRVKTVERVPAKKRVYTYHHTTHVNLHYPKNTRAVKKRRHKHFVKGKSGFYVHTH